MNSSAPAGSIAPRLSTILTLPDAVQAAEQISRLATDPGCARDCVFFVLREISTCQQPGKLLPLIDLLYRLSLLSNACLTQALQRLQSDVIKTLQLSVPQIPEYQKQQLDSLRKEWLAAVQAKSRSGQVFLQDVATWLTGADRSNNPPSRQQVTPTESAATAAPSLLLPSDYKGRLAPSQPHAVYPLPPSCSLPPPPPRPSSAIQAPPPNQQRAYNASALQAPGQAHQAHNNQVSGWDTPDAPAAGLWSGGQVQQLQWQQPQQHGAQRPVQNRDASPEQLTQHLHMLSLQPTSRAVASGRQGSNQQTFQPGGSSATGSQRTGDWLQANSIVFQPEQAKADQFAWVAAASLKQVRQRLGELRQVRAMLHQEERLLHARRQELDPTSGRPLKIFCWCGKELPKWVLGDTYCGRERPGEPRGHKLCITFMQCTECKCKKSVAVNAPTDECWCPKQWHCPGCSKELHGATCSKAGSNIVVVH